MQTGPTPIELAAIGIGVIESKEIVGEWLGHYFDLIASGLCTRRQAAYAAWYSASKRYRLPRTQDELATLLNYKSPQVFFKWRHQKWFNEAVNRVGLALLEDYNADAHRRLIYLALNETGSPGVAALRLFFERGGQLAPVGSEDDPLHVWLHELTRLKDAPNPNPPPGGATPDPPTLAEPGPED